MANQLVPQGTLNRLLTSLQVISLPALNVTRGYFGTRLAAMTFEGDGSDYIRNLTGATPSPRPYQVVTVVAYLNKSQPLSQSWENQRKTNTNIGDVNITTDSPVLGPYYLSNCQLMNIAGLELTGETNDFPVSLQGTYYINAALYT